MSSAATSQEIIDFFNDPRSYDHAVERVEHHQTHISHLFFAGDYVYKVKKPLDLGFLDFTTLAKRRAAAVAELQLNRRISPDIYLDIVAVHRADDGSLNFNAPTHVIEVAVVMKRLADGRRLSSLIEAGEAEAEMLTNLGRLVAHFHKRAETSPEIERFGSVEVIERNWRESFEQTEAFIGRTISRENWQHCRREIERFLRVFPDLFEARVRDGWIRDCHGDMLTDDIFFDSATNAAYVLDCIEFNARFRYSDTLADIAFPSMDLRLRGAPELAEIFLDAYYANISDRPLPALLRFYESYRAFVRGKVRSFVIDESETTAEQKNVAEADARRYFAFAAAAALALRPRLVLIGGLMGSGKTTIADALGELCGIRVVHSDVVRKRLAGIEPEESVRAEFGAGPYTSEWTERTYTALLEEGRAELARAGSVILDATWSRQEHRRRARALATEREAILAIVECSAPAAVLEARLSTPRAISDGRLELLADQRAAYEAPAEEEGDRMLRVDTAADTAQSVRQIAGELFTPESQRYAGS